MAASTTFGGPLSVHLAWHFFPAFGPGFFDRIKELNDDEPWLEDPEDNTAESEPSFVSFALPVRFAFLKSFWRTAKVLMFQGPMFFSTHFPSWSTLLRLQTFLQI